jgi:hypothetical protein
MIVDEDAGRQVVSAYVTDIANVDPSSAAFVLELDRPDLFAQLPSITPDGSLTFTGAPDGVGSARLRVVLSDASGMRSTVQPSSITIRPVNDAPVAPDVTVTIAEDAPAATIDVLTGANDIDGDTLTVAALDTTALTHGNVQLVAGLPVYTPLPDENGIDTFTATITDGAGGTATATITITIAPVNDAPVAQDDAFSTGVDSPITIQPANLLANDWDADADSLSVSAPTITTGGGTIDTNGDGSYTYTPCGGCSGDVVLTYSVSDGAGGSDFANVTITVSSTIQTDTYYLSPGAASSSNWVLASTPSGDPLVLDYDGDGSPGLTLKKSDGKITVSDPAAFRNFDLAPAQPLKLNGPVTLALDAAIKGLVLNKDAHPHVYVQDCALDGTGCIVLRSFDVHVNPWSLLVPWQERTFTLGTVNATILPGRILRVKLLNDHNDMWVAMSNALSSRVTFTVEQ